MKWKQIFFFIQRFSFQTIHMSERIFILPFFVKSSRPKCQRTDFLLFHFILLLLSQFQLMFQIILTLLVGKYFKIAELPDLFHFLAMSLHLKLLLFLIEGFLTICHFILHVILNFIQSLVENSTMFEFIGYVLSEVSEVR